MEVKIESTEIIELLETVAKEVNVMSSIDEETVVYGKNGILNSLALVRLIVDIENYISQKYAIDVFLTSDRLYSSKNSPFSSVNSLTNYVNQEIGKQR